MESYATVAEIRNLGLQTDAPPGVWDFLAPAASQMFDNLCEVAEDFFALAPSPVSYTSRVFIGDGSAYLKLDPFTALNTVTPIVIDTAFTYAIPVYSIVNHSLVVLERTKRQSDEYALYYDRYTGWRKGVKITVSANWGFATIPADIKLAVAKMALSSWRLADPVNAGNTASESEPIIDGLPASVWPIVEKYRQKHSRRAMFA